MMIFFLTIIHLGDKIDSPWHFSPSFPFIQASSCSVLLVSKEACSRVENRAKRQNDWLVKFPKLKCLGEGDSLVKTKCSPTVKGDRFPHCWGK